MFLNPAVTSTRKTHVGTRTFGWSDRCCNAARRCKCRGSIWELGIILPLFASFSWRCLFRMFLFQSCALRWQETFYYFPQNLISCLLVDFCDVLLTIWNPSAPPWGHPRCPRGSNLCHRFGNVTWWGLRRLWVDEFSITNQRSCIFIAPLCGISVFMNEVRLCSSCCQFAFNCRWEREKNFNSLRLAARNVFNSPTHLELETKPQNFGRRSLRSSLADSEWLKETLLTKEGAAENCIQDDHELAQHLFKTGLGEREGKPRTNSDGSGRPRHADQQQLPVLHRHGALPCLAATSRTVCSADDRVRSSCSGRHSRHADKTGVSSPTGQFPQTGEHSLSRLQSAEPHLNCREGLQEPVGVLGQWCAGRQNCADYLSLHGEPLLATQDDFEMLHGVFGDIRYRAVGRGFCGVVRHMAPEPTKFRRLPDLRLCSLQPPGAVLRSPGRPQGRVRAQMGRHRESLLRKERHPVREVDHSGESEFIFNSFWLLKPY